MAKKVLLAEKSTAIRNIAESLLRQGGYEVLSAEDIDSARDILHGSKIDLLLISSDLDDKEGLKYFDVLGSDSATAMIPLLVLHDQTAGALAYPPEATINKPFTPREFMETVTAFSGGAGNTQTVSQTPFEGSDVEDDIIDAALGLDKLDIDEAEVMGSDTGAFRKINKKNINESMVGYDFKASADDSTITKRKEPEQINIPAESTPQAAAAPTEELAKDAKKSEKPEDFLGADSSQMKQRPANGMTASSKIEIITDQYGLTDPTNIPEAAGPETDKKKDGHDYNWFLKEMREGGASPESPASDMSESSSLQISTTSEGLNPVAPPPKSASQPESKPVVEKSPPEATSHNEAVDKFINEFKQEMQKISDEPVPKMSVPGASAESGQSKDGRPLAWEEAVEKITAAEMQAISQKIVDLVIRQVGERIKDILTPEMVAGILESSINESLKNIRENMGKN